MGSATASGRPAPSRPTEAGSTALRIQHRLTLTIVVVATISTLLAAVFLHVSVGRRVTAQMIERLHQEVLLARILLAEETDLGAVADRLADRIGSSLGLRMTIVAADGTVLGDSDLNGIALRNVENHAGRPEIIAALRDGSGSSI
ncbi:MAG TPA: hypothetical protein VFG08_07320, partial [Candidatus Polarisedimenticolia bacterium]|nr:hypothetical protein [Candidatus Polarisedimenticolia bacterium]